MSTIVKGNAAEAAVMKAFVAAGLPVLMPFGGGSPYDLGVELSEGRLARVQVKTGRVRNGCVEFNACGTDHGRGQQSYEGRADLLAVYVEQLDRVFVVPVSDCPRYRGYLRLTPAANNQQRRVRSADEYSLDAWLASVRPYAEIDA